MYLTYRAAPPLPIRSVMAGALWVVTGVATFSLYVKCALAVLKSGRPSWSIDSGWPGRGLDPRSAFGRGTPGNQPPAPTRIHRLKRAARLSPGEPRKFSLRLWGTTKYRVVAETATRSYRSSRTFTL
jgi:hypothetical protein